MKGIVPFESRDCGGRAAWSLHNPQKPEYGQWVWVNVVGKDIIFIKKMTQDEIAYIRRHYTIWATQWPGTQWAIVLGVPGGSDIKSSYTSGSATHSIGV